MYESASDQAEWQQHRQSELERYQQQQLLQQQELDSSLDLTGNEPPAKKGPGRRSKGKQDQPRARKQPAKDSAAKSDTPKPSSRSWEDTKTINLLECWYYRHHDFKTAGKNGAKLAQIWTGVYEKLCDLMPGIKDVFSVKSCKDRVSNIRTKYKHAYDSMLLSGEARPRWVDTELYVKCTDVFGGDPSVNPTAILDDDIPAGKEGAECAMNEDSGTIMDDGRHLWNNKIEGIGNRSRSQH
ncbi:TPA: hypothetical protein ACH3X1_011925 [Trebouxia sp. C0004]